MATLLQDSLRSRQSVPLPPVIVSPPASNGFVCRKRSAVGIDPVTGQAVRSDPTIGYAGLASLIFVGCAEQAIDNTANASPPPNVLTDTGIWAFNHNGTLNGTEPTGIPLFQVDDDTIDKTDRAATLPFAGYLHQHVYDSLGNYTNTVLVMMAPPLIGKAQIVYVKKRILAPGGTGAGAYVLSAAATSEQLALGTVPPGCLFMGGSITVPTLFSGGSSSAVVLDINGSGVQTIVNGCNVFTGATGFPKFSPLGADISAGFMNPALGGVALTAKIRVTGDNVANLTAGEAQLRLAFLRG